MSDCCGPGKEAACALPQSRPGFCPACGAKGRSVSTLTVKSLVRDHTRVPASDTYLFCRTADCEVVYFSDQAVFRKPDLKVRVGIKESEDPVPLCYCFDYTRADVRRELEDLGTSSIPERIKTEVQAGFCACEVKNPSGNCCLGDIAHAIQALVKPRSDNAGERAGGRAGVPVPEQP